MKLLISLLLISTSCYSQKKNYNDSSIKYIKLWTKTLHEINAAKFPNIPQRLFDKAEYCYAKTKLYDALDYLEYLSKYKNQPK